MRGERSIAAFGQCRALLDPALSGEPGSVCDGHDSLVVEDLLPRRAVGLTPGYEDGLTQAGDSEKADGVPVDHHSQVRCSSLRRVVGREVGKHARQLR